MSKVKNKRLEKHSLRVVDLPAIPSQCFIDELDLTEHDKREISNPAKDGWIIAYIDSLRENERDVMEKLVMKNLTFLDPCGHYVNVQMPWVNRSQELYSLLRGVDPDSQEAAIMYAEENSGRFRIAYPLLYPEMVFRKESALETINEREVELLKCYFGKAEEVSSDNYRRHGPKGLNDFLRAEWAKAKTIGVPWAYEPCYQHLIPQEL